MKPKNKFQKQILKYSQSLPPLSPYQRNQAIKHVAPHIAKHNSKKQYICLDCGHIWTGERAEKVTCPHCSAKLKVSLDRRRKYRHRAYFAVVTKCHGLQVVRIFLLDAQLKQGKSVRYDIDEVFQTWITPEGKTTIVGLKRNTLSMYYDSWVWGSGMEIRAESFAHHVNPFKIIGRTSVIPEIARNGFKGDFHGINPKDLFVNLLISNKVETAWKAGQYELVDYAISCHVSLASNWPSIKIAIRNKYYISDASMWWDLLRDLHVLGKDLRNPKFVCPENLHEAHDYWINQRRIKEAKEERIREQRRRELDIQKYLENQEKVKQEEGKYREDKSRFLDLKFQDNEITVTPLQSVREFLDEGHLMHHCVFSNKYYEKSDSLILHAVIDNVSIATIELSLDSFKIIQCRGVHNSVPPHNDRIRALIEKHLNEIIKITQKQIA